MLEDANIRFDFIDIEDADSPRMEQIIALTGDKELPQLFVEGWRILESNKFDDILGHNFSCLAEPIPDDCPALSENINTMKIEGTTNVCIV